MTQRTQSLIVVLGLLGAAAYLASSMRTGFIPHDEGLLAQSAARVLAGETPHLDFVDPYTGALSYWHAGAFRLLGARSSSLRIVLLGASIIFIGAYFLLAKRFLSPPIAAATTFIAVAWSLKNYFAPLPSWYNLFFATVGTLLLIIAQEQPRRARLWVFSAGLMGGASMLFKVTGVFFVVAGLLSLLYDSRQPDEGISRQPRSPSQQLTTFLLCLAPVGAATFSWVVMRVRLEPTDIAYFVLPIMLVSFIPWRAHARSRRAATNNPLITRLATFLGGVLLPLTLFAGSYFASSYQLAPLQDLYHGVFVLPQLRSDAATLALPPLSSWPFAIPALLLFTPGVQKRLDHRLVVVATVLVLASILVSAASSTTSYQSVWLAVRLLVPLFVLLGSLQSLSDGGDSRVFLLTAMVAMTSLIQYPYAFATYLFYVAPLLLLLIIAVWKSEPKGRGIQLVISAFALLFVIFLLNGTNPRKFGDTFEPKPELALLAPEHINLWVPVNKKLGYEVIDSIVQSQTLPNEHIWAGPDAPEIYWLTQRINYLRSSYAFLEPGWEQRLVDAIRQGRIRLAVINRAPEFSGPISDETFEVITSSMPNSVAVGPMMVFWSDRDSI